MKVDLFDFDLPAELIAQHPVEPRDAARMLDLGLVSEVCPAAEIADRADRLCAELGALSGGALAVAKQSLAGGLGLGLREAMARHVEAQSEAFRLARERGQM